VETLASAETAGPKSLLQREKDRKRGRKISLDSVLFPFYPSPQDDLPSAGPKSPPWREFVPDPTPQHVNLPTPQHLLYPNTSYTVFEYVGWSSVRDWR
jgi:hypothetical protein